MIVEYTNGGYGVVCSRVDHYGIVDVFPHNQEYGTPIQEAWLDLKDSEERKTFLNWEEVSDSELDY